MSGSLASITARIRGTSLGAKLAFVGAMLTAAVIGGAFIVLRISTANDVRRVFVSEMQASQHALRRIEQHDRLLLLRQAVLLSASPTLHAALDTWRSESAADSLAPQRLRTLSNVVNSAFSELDDDMLAVTDAHGTVIASAGDVAGFAPGRTLDRMPAVHAALEEEAAGPDSLVGVLAGASTPVEAAVVPVLVDGYAIGTLIVGKRIDRIVPADTIAGTRAVVASDTIVLASSLHGLGSGAAWRPLVRRIDSTTSTLTLGGEEYVTAAVPIGRGETDRPVVLFLLRPLSAAVGPIESSLTRRFALAALLAIGLVALGGAVLSRTTLRPLSDFVGFMESASRAKDYARFHATAGTPTEIRTLTGTYNRLIESLRIGNAELERRTLDLASTNEELSAEIERRERAELALRESEEQLRQAQKLEALGALAGGVAHDFNNILSIILGYAEIVQGELDAGTSQHADVRKITDAATRARTLVRQLLAFSRKQVLQPQLLDLNEVVEGVRPLLRPLIGENVTLDLNLAPGLSSVTADRGQIEQVVVNLAVNARDAMPDGGRITIETANVVLADRGGSYPVSAGPVVMLAVADTGVGMDAATRARIFEPFFTTKPVGRGTGLGLATVYGIVRQSEGNITVFSEPGHGSVFRCYFPATTSDVPAGADGVLLPEPSVTGGETILLAEDEPELRALMTRSLERQGYNVLSAADGAEALMVGAEHDGPIHMLVSDVVMPEVSGTQLARQLGSTRPEMRVLFLSGYSDEAIERDGVLAPGSVFLEKPVTPEALAQAVRDLLDSEPAGVRA